MKWHKYQIGRHVYVTVSIGGSGIQFGVWSAASPFTMLVKHPLNPNWLSLHLSLISMHPYWFLTVPLKFCGDRCVWSSCFIYPIQKEIVSSAEMCGNGNRGYQRGNLLCSTVVSLGLVFRNQQSLHCISQGLMHLFFFFYAYQHLEWSFLSVMFLDWGSMVLSLHDFLVISHTLFRF